MAEQENKKQKEETKQQKRKKAMVKAGLIALAISDVCAAYLITTSLILKRSADYETFALVIDQEEKDYDVTFESPIQKDHPVTYEITLQSSLVERVNYNVSLVAEDISSTYASYLYVSAEIGDQSYINNTLDQVINTGTLFDSNINNKESQTLKFTYTLLPSFRGAYDYVFKIVISSRNYLI